MSKMNVCLKNLLLMLREAKKFQTFGRVLQRKDFWLLLSAYFTFLGKLRALFLTTRNGHILTTFSHFFLNFAFVSIYTDKWETVTTCFSGRGRYSGLQKPELAARGKLSSTGKLHRRHGKTTVPCSNLYTANY